MTDKLSEEDRASIYAAMAEIEDEDDAARAARNPFLQNASGEKTISIPLGNGQSVEVPSFGYMKELERTIRAQAARIEKLERHSHRTDAKIRTQRAHINGQGSRINDVNRELEQKIDRRD